MIQSLQREEYSDEHGHSSDENATKAFTMAIISKMDENEKHFRAWQAQQGDLPRDKTVLIENVSERLNEDGTESFIVTKSKDKNTKARDMNNFSGISSIPDMSDDEQP